MTAVKIFVPMLGNFEGFARNALSLVSFTATDFKAGRRGGGPGGGAGGGGGTVYLALIEKRKKFFFF